MKKVVLSLAVLFSVAMVACSNKEAATTDTDSVVAEETVDSTVADSTVADSVVADSVAPAAETPAE